MMRKVVLDTNVLISGTFWRGDSFRIILLVEQGKIKNFLSLPILNEYERVMVSDEIVEKIKDKELVRYFPLFLFFYTYVLLIIQSLYEYYGNQFKKTSLFF